MTYVVCVRTEEPEGCSRGDGTRETRPAGSPLTLPIGERAALRAGD